MEIIQTKDLTFTYPNSETPALDSVSLSVNSGEFIILCGRSGCGKSTLLRQLKPLIAPHGEKSGSIEFSGKPISQLTQREQCEKIGFIMQNPDNQIVTDKVWHELAFGLESLSIPENEIRARVAEMASFFGIGSWFHKKTSDLSGGQKQLLNLASAMIMQPSVLLLDEPTSQLDPIAAQNFLDILSKVNRELGTTIILAEHRLEEAIPISDRIIVMSNGMIVSDGTPAETGKNLYSSKDPMFYALPAPIQIYYSVDNGIDCPITISQSREWLEKKDINKKITFNDTYLPDNQIAVTVNDVWFRHEKKLPDILKGFSLSIPQGEIYALLGGNGSGKTTALSVICSIIRPYRGKVITNGKVSMLPQNPSLLFTRKTVELDLMEMCNDKNRIKEIAEFCGLTDLLNRHPYDLSGGELERAGLAKVLLTEPDILLLDEPTKGLDPDFKHTFANILSELKKTGVTIIIVSHDIEFCARYADRCGMLFDGAIVSEDRPRRFFSGMSFYTTSANRIARDIIPDAILTDDVISACGGKPFITKPQVHTRPPVRKKTDTKSQTIDYSTGSIREKKKITKRSALAAALSLMAIPLTIFFGAYYLGNRKYYFISLLIIIETLLPFVLIFESRKPKARELIVISVLCAIAVAGRSAFYMIPQIKPALAIVIISGVSLGAETGFLVGAVTAFVSNCFFAQGPWTPWQMFAFGIAGLLAGLLFRKNDPKKLSLCLFGAVAAMLYGAIMNPASVLIYDPTPTKEIIMSAYALGLPFDLLHALSTALFLWFISKPMTEKLERIKTKYKLI